MENLQLGKNRKFWFPTFRILAFVVIFSVGMTIFLNIFNPHIELDSKEWENKPKISRQMEFFIRLLKVKGKTHEK